MPPKIATIPRFLLPQTGAIWRNQIIRNATTKSKAGKPLVLEKPAKFNPPSHGSRITKGPPRYQYAGPQMTEEERAAQARKQYPNLMPPEGTFMYWFINNKSIHLYITMVWFLCKQVITQILIVLSGRSIITRIHSLVHELQAKLAFRTHASNMVRNTISPNPLDTNFLPCSTTEYRIHSRRDSGTKKAESRRCAETSTVQKGARLRSE